MKNKRYTLTMLLGATIFGLNAELDFNSIDLVKITDTTKNFAMGLSDSSVNAIKNGVDKTLNNLPNDILGVNILEIKDNVINADLVVKINQVIQNAYNTIQNIKPFVKDPKTGLMLITTLYNVMSTQIPQSIKDVFVNILALAKKLVDSKDPQDIAALAALQTIVIASNGIIEKLYNNKNNIANALNSQDISSFKAIVSNNAEIIKNLIERNDKELQDIFAKARKINAADLAKFEKDFKTGFATAKSLLS